MASTGLCWACDSNDLPSDHSCRECPYIYGTWGSEGSAAGTSMGSESTCGVETSGAIPKSEGLTDQGDMSANVDVAENTILTANQETVASTNEATNIIEDEIKQASSTEKCHEFESILNRWIPVANFECTKDGKIGDTLATILLPQSLFSGDACSPNTLPFEQFIYGQYDVTLQLRANANPFQCGKVVMNIVPEPGNLDINTIAYGNVYTGLQRPSVIVDLCGNNVAELDVSWLFHRSMVRATKNSSLHPGTLGGVFAGVMIQVLSPLNVVATERSSVALTAYFKFRKAKFSGMSYRQPIKQQGILGVADDFMSGVRMVDKMYCNMRRSMNCDKPSNVLEHNVIIPRPHWGFCHTKGITDSVPLNFCPASSTSYPESIKGMIGYRNMVSIARVWGVIDVFKWREDHKVGTDLYTMRVDPSFMKDHKATTYVGVASPLEYISSMYQFWRGTLELRFDFVSTQLHTGLVQISIEFGRQITDSVDLCSSASTYVKTFDMREQKSVEVVIPYIYDTTWRRTACIPFIGVDKTATEVSNVQSRTGVLWASQTLVRMRVLNAMRQAATVPNEISVIVFARAGEDFDLMCPIANNFRLPYGVSRPNNFPEDGYVVNAKFTVTKEIMEIKRGKKTTANIDPFAFKEETVEVEIKKNGKYEKLKVKLDKEQLPGTRVMSELTQYIGHMSGPTELTTKVLRRLPSVITYGDDGKEHLYIVEGNEHYPLIVTEPKVEGQGLPSEDTTANLKRGPVFRNLQFNDPHIIIKDMLRRPVKIVTNYIVPSRATFFLPAMPLTHDMITPEANAVYSVGCIHSPMVGIMAMFRFFRGGQRFTIVQKDDMQSGRTMVGCLPQSGCRMIGVQSFPFGRTGETLFDNFDIAQQGLPVEVIVTSVNPMVTVEVPYNTMNNWTVLHQTGGAGDFNANFTWRDKADDNVGHLFITNTSGNGTSYDIYWSAGDDFEVTGFLGAPPGSNWIHGATLYDNHGVSAQAMDKFYNPRSIKNGIKMLVKPAILASVGYVAPPLVAPAAGLLFCNTLTQAEAVVTKANKLLDVSEDSVTQILNNTTDITNRVNSILNIPKNICESVTSVVNYMLELCPNVSSHVSSVVTIAVQYIEQIWGTITFENLNNMIFSIFSLLGVWASSVKDLVMQLLYKISSFVFTVGQDDEEKDVGAVVSLTLGLGSILFGATMDKSKGHIIERVFRQIFLSNTWSLMNNACNYIKNTFKYFKQCFYQMLGFANVQNQSLVLLAENSKFLQCFIEDANIFLQDVNINQLLKSPIMKTRFWLTVVNAYQISSVMAMCPEKKVSPMLMYICKELIKKSNENSALLSTAPVKYEPFVVCIEGSPGIGKSVLSHQMVVELLKNIGFKQLSTELVYVRTPGNEFWNGYKDQPVVVYDDWLNIKTDDEVSRVIGELYGLKTSGRFNPPFARLEDKDISVSPAIVVLLCNDAYPGIQVSGSIEAVFRRRDLVIKASKKKNVSMKDVKKQSLGKTEYSMDHLEFRRYSSAVDRKNLGGPMEWDKFLCVLKEEHTKYHVSELSNVKKRLALFTQRIQEGASKVASIQDPYCLFFSALHEPEADNKELYIPSEELTRRCHTIIEYLGSAVVGSQANYDLSLVEVGEFNQRRFDILVALLHREGVAHDSRYDKVLQVITGLTVYNRIRQYPTDFAMYYRSLSRQVELSNNATSFKVLVENGLRSHMVPAQEFNLERLQDGLSLPCAVCELTLPVAVICPNSVRDNMHVMCLTCSLRCIEAQDQLRCPVCRNAGLVRKRSWPHPIDNGSVMALLNLFGGASLYGLSYVIGVVKQFLSGLISTYKAFVRVSPLVNFIMGAYGISQGLYIESAVLVFKGGLGFWANELFNPSQEWFEDTLGVSYIEHLQERARLKAKQFLRSNMISYFDQVQVVGQALEYFDDEKRVSCVRCEHGLWPGSMCVYSDVTDKFTFYDVEEDVVREFPNALCEGSCQWTSDYRKQFLLEWEESNALYLARSRDLAPPELQPRRVVNCKWYNSITTALSEFRIWLVDTTCDLWNKYKWILGIVIPVIGVGIYIYSRKNGDIVVPQSYAEDQSRVGRIYRVGGTNFKRNVRQQSNWEGISNKMYRNLVQLVIRNGNQEKWLTIVGVRGRSAVCLNHYYNIMKANKEHNMILRMVEHPTLEIPYVFSDEDFSACERGDLRVMKLPPQFPMMRDIVKYMMTIDELESATLDLEGSIMVPPIITSSDQVEVHTVFFDMVVGHQTVIDQAGAPYSLEGVVQYNYSRQGACGSIVLSSHHERPLMAIHAAGVGMAHNGKGYGLLVWQEMFANAQGCADFEDVLVDNVRPKIALDTVGVVMYGGVNPDLTVYIPNKTQIELSVIAERLPGPSTAPVMLSSRDPRYIETKRTSSPYREGLEKHGIIVAHIPTPIVKKVEEVLKIWIKQFKPLRTVGVLTMKQAVEGIPGLKYYDRINMQSSAGWPFVTQRGAHMKKCNLIEFGSNDQFVSLREDLEKEIFRKNMLRRRGIRPATIFMDLPKDERKLISKISKEGSTRIFCASPIDYTLVVRQFTLDFVAMFMNHRFFTMSAVGMDCDLEFGSLYAHLTANSNKFVALDYKDFGPAFSTQMYEVFMEIMVEWYKPFYNEEQVRVLRVILEEQMNSYHIAHDLIYQQFSGAPSGSPLTVIQNSIVNICYVVMCWLELTHESFEVFLNNVRLVTYGDDLIMTVTEAFIPIFNARTIISHLATYRIKATPFDKGDNVQDWYTWDQVDFLKRKFVVHPTRPYNFLAQLPESVIEDCAKFIRKSPSRVLATRENAEASVRLAYTRGQEYFEMWRERVNMALIEQRIQPIILTWVDLDELVFEKQESLLNVDKVNSVCALRCIINTSIY